MTTSAAPKGGTRVAVQKFGTFLSGMIMPNIAAFIAWGLITAFFIETGWTPIARLGGFGIDPDKALIQKIVDGQPVFDTAGNAVLVGQSYTGIVGPMITYLLPLLIAAQGGRMIYGIRGAVVGSIATMGVIAGTDVPMFLGAMIMGPLGAWVMKELDKIWDGKIKPGFEMLVNNFSAGIAGGAMAVAASSPSVRSSRACPRRWAMGFSGWSTTVCYRSPASSSSRRKSCS